MGLFTQQDGDWENREGFPGGPLPPCPNPAWTHQGHTCILFQLDGASPQETWEKSLRFLSLQVKSQVSHQHENSYVSGAGLAGELGLTAQLPWVFRPSDGEGAVLFRSKRSQVLLPVLPSSKLKVSGASAVETGAGRAESSFQGRLWGRGRGPRHPHCGLSSWAAGFVFS